MILNVIQGERASGKSTLARLLTKRLSDIHQGVVMYIDEYNPIDHTGYLMYESHSWTSQGENHFKVLVDKMDRYMYPQKITYDMVKNGQVVLVLNASFKNRDDIDKLDWTEVFAKDKPDYVYSLDNSAFRNRFDA